MLKPKLQYFGHLMQKSDSLDKTLMLESLKAGGEGDDRECYGWMASPTQWTWVWVNSRSWWWTGKPGMLQSMGSLRVGHNWAAVLNSHTHTHTHTHIYFYRPHCAACTIFVPQSGFEPRLLTGQHGVLTTGLLGNSCSVVLCVCQLYFNKKGNSKFFCRYVRIN